MKKLLRILVVLTFILTISAHGTACQKKENGVILISIYGLRQDAVANTEYGRYLMQNSAYSLDVQTVSPSITLPCHLSMFYGVSPDVHGVLSNTFSTNNNLRKGIAETLIQSSVFTSIFYNWQPITNTVGGVAVVNKYISADNIGWERANELTAEACINHLNNTPSNLVVLYLGFLDENGHAYGWLSQEYYYALNQSFFIAQNVVSVAKELNYTVIITSDHGGHDYTHGTTLDEDMKIPLFIIGNGYEKGRNLGTRSILDIAPTITTLLGCQPQYYWQGTAII